MKYDIKAIETTYKGRVYRSRHEANWAAFFDLLNWGHEYEPFDLNGWLPDFQITGNKYATQELLVEVKPYEPESEPEAFQKKIDTIAKAVPVGKKFLFVGLKPQFYNSGTRIGKVVSGGEFGAYHTANAVLKKYQSREEFVRLPVDNYDITSDGGHDCFFIDQTLNSGQLKDVDYESANALWGHAKNKVKWVVRNRR